MFKPYQNLQRYIANIDHFVTQAPQLAAVIPTVQASSRLVADEHGRVNIDLGGGALFYPDHSSAASERQVENYLEQPLRLTTPPSAVDPACVELNRFIADMAQRMKDAPRAERPAPFSGYAVIFGMGLGHHVPLLADALNVRHLIVVEPHDELIAHSMHVIDWQALDQSLAAQGRGLTILRGTDPFARLIAALRGPLYPYVEGTYLFNHYQTDLFADITRRFFNERDLGLVQGWIEDQCSMFRNNTANFLRPGFYLQRRKVPDKRALPAFVVGAGPSLDGDVETIRRFRDQVVLISAGSAMRVLLANGILPDIHCELENDPTLIDVVRLYASRRDLSDVVLYATPTIHPDIAPYFREVIYYFRDGLNSTGFYAHGAQATLFSEPTAGNTAVFGALSLGFKDLYLFGLDFGAKDAERHHSKDSVYYTYEDKKELATWVPYDLDERVPGNFGGEVLTGWVLNWGRKNVTNAIREAGDVRVRNCSDGAAIALATPTAVEDIDLPKAAVSPRTDVDAALAALTRYTDKVVLPAEMAALRQAYAAFFTDMRSILDVLDGDGTPQERAIAMCDPGIGRLLKTKRDESTVYDTVNSEVQRMLGLVFHHATNLPETGADRALAQLKAGAAEHLDRLERIAVAELQGMA